MFRFTIRDVLLLTVVVALGGAWWVDRSRLAARINSDAWRIAGLEQQVSFQHDEISKLKAAALKVTDGRRR